MEHIAKLLERIAIVDNSEPGDHQDAEGFLVCHQCGHRKQTVVDWPDFETNGTTSRKVPIACRCVEERAREDKLKRRRIEIEQMWSDGLMDRAYLTHSFADDDGANPKYTDVCRRYVAHWPEMKTSGTGMMFFGPVGTGKSFLACATANALLNQNVSVCITNPPRIINCLSAATEKQALVDRLQKYELLVIDDLGSERDTSYAAEQIYSVIDARQRAGLPLIITTNLDTAEMENCQDATYKRIYDRVLEMCPVRILLAGKSRRRTNAEDRADSARKLLGLK